MGKSLYSSPKRAVEKRSAELFMRNRILDHKAMVGVKEIQHPMAMNKGWTLFTVRLPIFKIRGNCYPKFYCEGGF
jgi:hypothetical protein